VTAAKEALVSRNLCTLPPTTTTPAAHAPEKPLQRSGSIVSSSFKLGRLALLCILYCQFPAPVELVYDGAPPERGKIFHRLRVHVTQAGRVRLGLDVPKGILRPTQKVFSEVVRAKRT